MIIEVHCLVDIACGVALGVVCCCPRMLKRQPKKVRPFSRRQSIRGKCKSPIPIEPASPQKVIK